MDETITMPVKVEPFDFEPWLRKLPAHLRAQSLALLRSLEVMP